MKYLIFVGLLFYSSFAKAQNTAEDFFNQGSFNFVHSKIDNAKLIVNKGLDIFPSDQKLNALKKEIEEEEKKKKNQKKEEKEEEKKDNNNKKKEKEKKSKDKEGEKDKDKEGDNEDKNGERRKKKQQPQSQKNKLSKQQIKQLLEAMNNEENKTQKKINAKKAKGKKIKQEKDW